MIQGEKKEEQAIGKETQAPITLNIERIAQHEAAHGIVWYLFKQNWTVNQLTIEKDNLPDASMNGALHISPIFGEGQNIIERANEIFAIALAGMIGQNIDLLIQRENLLFEIANAAHFNQILDTTGCGGDFEIASNYLEPLAKQFGINESSFSKYKVMDLVNMFQSHYKVQEIHNQLTQTLLERGTINRQELLDFFDAFNFQVYVEDENLDINFYNKS